jgi:hypothetical protein
MIYLKDTSHYEELIVKDRVISIARKMAEQGRESIVKNSLVMYVD